MAYQKPFSFSYSKLKNFDTCPKRYYEIDVAKNFKEADSDELKGGNAVHKALADRVMKDTPLPVGMECWEDMCKRLDGARGTKNVELQLAINADFGACTWFSRETWFRAIADLLIIDGPVAMAWDYKTGKIVEDTQQLALMAAAVFAHYPEVMAIRTEYVWLKYDAFTTEDFRRSDMPAMWQHVWPRIKALEHATKASEFPAKPGALCRKWCPVKSCVHNGAS